MNKLIMMILPLLGQSFKNDNAAKDSGIYKIIKVILYVLTGFFIYKFLGTYLKNQLRKIFPMIGAKAIVNKHEESKTTGATGKTIALQDVAQNMYTALYGTSGWKFTEDEELFLAEIKQVSKSDIPKLAIEYGLIEGKNKNMYKDASKYLSTSQYNEIRKLLS